MSQLVYGAQARQGTNVDTQAGKCNEDEMVMTIKAHKQVQVKVCERGSNKIQYRRNTLSFITLVSQ